MTPVTPNATYHYPSKIALRIATGGSGQSGLLEALAEEFIKFTAQDDPQDDCDFAIEWYTSDTSGTIDHLIKKIVDVGITYHAIAEYTALNDKVIDRVEYVWRDHWMLVGPKNNPAELPTDKNIYVLLTKLFSALEKNKEQKTPIKFLSRYDSSACNIKESSLWTTIGQTPWAPPVATWYHMMVDFPFQAIRAASQLGEYTLTDYGTWCSIEEDVRDKLAIFAQGKDDEKDPLLNPAHLLVGTDGENKVMANKFADWMIKEDGGQKVIKGFEKNGVQLYTTAPLREG